MTTIIAPRVHDLGGGFNVRRAVPSLQARSVGPFVFVDHMGPAVFEPGRGIDVRPHPHIGRSACSSRQIRTFGRTSISRRRPQVRYWSTRTSEAPP